MTRGRNNRYGRNPVGAQEPTPARRGRVRTIDLSQQAIAEQLIDRDGWESLEQRAERIRIERVRQVNEALLFAAEQHVSSRGAGYYVRDDSTGTVTVLDDIVDSRGMIIPSGTILAYRVDSVGPVPGWLFTDQASPTKLPTPMHPEAGKIIARPRMKRSMMGVPIDDVRQPNGGLRSIMSDEAQEDEAREDETPETN